MATQSGAITSSDAQYRQGYAKELYYEGVVKNPILKALTENNCINRENDLSKNNGGTLTMYNRLRIDSQGQIGDVDFYSLAEQTETNSRTISIAKNSLPITWYLKGSQSQQYAAFMLDDGVREGMSEWLRALMTSSYINQLCGNNATSITQPSLSNTAFSGALIGQVTGNNTPTAPTYWYEANLGGAITTDANVDSGNTLSLKDFELATTLITSQASRATWATLRDKSYIAIAFISYTGLYQLQREATTLGQGPQLNLYTEAMMAGGKTDIDLMTFQVPGIPIKFYVVPDTWMPRGVTTSGLSEKANTRRCVIVGHRALDAAFGAGFDGNIGAETGNGRSGQNTKIITGVNLEVDTNYKPLNKMAYGNASVLHGVKKSLATGTGSQAGTAFDLATYVITHYSAS